jgi:hypothetical protein
MMPPVPTAVILLAFTGGLVIGALLAAIGIVAYLGQGL